MIHPFNFEEKKRKMYKNELSRNGINSSIIMCVDNIKLYGKTCLFFRAILLCLLKFNTRAFIKMIA